MHRHVLSVLFVLCFAACPASEDATPDTSPDVMPDTTSEVAADSGPDIGPDSGPDVTPETTPDVAPETTPDIAPETDTAPDTSPDDTDVTPDTSPDDAVPDVDTTIDAEETSPDAADTSPDAADTTLDIADTTLDAADTTPDVPPCVPEANPTFCARLGKECGSVTGNDNCNKARIADCGECTAPESCGALTINQCDCRPETNGAFCSRNGATCGELTAADNCGVERTTTCGSCNSQSQCGSVTPNVCGPKPCVPEADATFCTRLNKECGSVSANDNCGAPRTATCGTCNAPESCGAVTANRCDCVAESNAVFCERQDKECGSFRGPDNCGTTRTANCGACTFPESCGAVEPNQCDCRAESDATFCARLGKDCGSITAPDSCGLTRTATCGACSGTNVCTDNVCAPPPCTAESDQAICTRLGKNCGSVSAVDNCGQSRFPNCGGCGSNQACSANVCVACTTENDATFCARMGKACGPASGTDNCGASRSVASCGGCADPQECLQGTCKTCDDSDAEVCASANLTCGSHVLAESCGKSGTRNCGDCGAGDYCHEGQCGPALGSLTVQGCCGGSDLYYRASGFVFGLSCEGGCGWNPVLEVYDCGVTGADPSGTHPQSCDALEFCVAESDAAMCTRLGRVCGSVVALDNCGSLRAIDECGACGASEFCHDEGLCCAMNGTAAGYPASCAGATCTPTSDAELCGDFGISCGPREVLDNCQTRRTLDCGDCNGDELCVFGTCECRPPTQVELCADAGLACGEATVEDLCGQTRHITCGACSANTFCNGGACEPSCGNLGYAGCCLDASTTFWCESNNISMASCSNGCGWLPATSEYYCGGSGADPGGSSLLCNDYTFCVPETNEAFCARIGRECGAASALDNCGRERTLDCGGCADGEYCNQTLGGTCTGPCGNLDYVGCCDGSVTRWCDGGELYSKDCGEDGCGWSARNNFYYCGTFAPNPTDIPPGDCAEYSFCRIETDAEFCARLASDCGVVVAPDSCGNERAVECGTCTGDDLCSAGYRCGCTVGSTRCNEGVFEMCNEDGQFVAQACNGVCEDYPLGAVCRVAQPVTHSGRITYEYRTLADSRAGWSDVVTAPLVGAIVTVLRNLDDDTGYLMASDWAVTDADGRYTVDFPEAAPSNDLVQIALAHPDVAGNIAYAVADPRIYAASPPYGPYDVIAQYKSATFHSVYVETDALGPETLIPISAHHGTARVFDYQRRAYDETLAISGAPGKSMVTWMQPRAAWDCGACFSDYARTSVQGYFFESSLWIGMTDDEAYWSDAVNAHELGHWAMASYGTSPNEGGTHYLTVPTLPGQAWSEGWATLFSSLVRGDELYFDSQDGSFFWFDLRELGYFLDDAPIAMTLPTADARGYPDEDDPILQLMDENYVAAMGLSIASRDWEVASPRLPTEGAFLFTTLSSDRMNMTAASVPFARGYVRHTWQAGGAGPTDIVAIPEESTPMFADYLDALRCEAALNGFDLDVLIAIAIGPYPYPIDLDPICYGDLP